MRFDLHAAFRPEAESALSYATKHFTATDGYYRPRYGVFVQADVCSQSNISRESVIPTFTCNFEADSFDQAHTKTQQAIHRLFDNELYGAILKKNFLRVRFEAQLNNVKYEPDNQSLQFIFPRPDSFPSEVHDLQYFDAHIHISGFNGRMLDLWQLVANAGAALEMPIIVNICKDELRPFLTKRWYNTTLEAVLKNLNEVYNTLYPQMQKLGLTLKYIPEVEMTYSDPDCQVTDQGWMPTPYCKFSLTEEHCRVPMKVIQKIH